ncbi:hypothetical protein Y032_0098g3128 [Ancylostoma ceylanicum]|uniref:Transposase n=1 Tax=Ancylostoma ceylanicum TaxID=53326 RepID=A0A016TJN7_9BILA|nr:hypothetical protein Y032_0098g3128 [Ancylostoma ceylanicum]
MDEKYCSYDYAVRRKHWVDFEELPKPQSKLKQHDKKELLSFWWDITGPVFWELVPTGSMVDSDLFCSQLEKVPESCEVATQKEKKFFSSWTTQDHTFPRRALRN